MKHMANSISLLLFFAIVCSMTWAVDEGNEKDIDAPKQERDLRPELEEISKLPVDAPETAERQQRLLIELQDRFIRAERVQFRISGIVVDEAGKPMEDVALGHSVFEPTPIRAGHTEAGRYVGGSVKRVDGDFTIEPKTKGKRVVLQFNKEGYYPEERSLDANRLDPQIDHDLLAGIMPKRSVTEIRDLKIVMQKMGELTTLQRHKSHQPLSFSADRSAVVLDLDEKHRQSSRLFGKLTRVADVTQPEHLPKLGAYLIADVAEDGTIPVVEVRHEDVISSSQGPAKVPHNLRLVLTDPAGGFILFHSDEAIKGRDQAARRMVRAPEKGYQQVLELTPEIARRGHLFFFKVGNLYGRGKLDAPRLSLDGKTFELRIEWQIQPNGSRNLETRSWDE